MAEINPNPNPNQTQRQLAWLKRIVALMGVLLVIGTLVLVTKLYFLITKPKPSLVGNPLPMAPLSASQPQALNPSGQVTPFSVVLPLAKGEQAQAVVANDSGVLFEITLLGEDEESMLIRYLWMDSHTGQLRGEWKIR